MDRTLVRHAAKPDDPSLGPGLTIEGAEDKHSLVVRGWQRAGAWTALFGSGAFGSDYPQPIAIYAADPTAAPTEDGTVSKRPHETILPLSQKLRLTPVTKYGVDDEVAMLDEVRALTGVVLIAWEHKRIAAAILPELAKGQSIPHLPGKWEGSRFDVVAVRSRAKHGVVELPSIVPEIARRRPGCTALVPHRLFGGACLSEALAVLWIEPESQAVDHKPPID